MKTRNEGKVVLVTGASGGIGRAIAVAAGREGYYILVHYGRNKEGAQATLACIRQDGGSGEILSFDVGNREECRRELEQVAERHGAPWGIVSNAGICSDGAFPALSDKDWDSVIHTNLDSFFNVIQPLTLPLCRKRRGRIITIASVSGIMGNRGQVNYSAAKAGIIGATKALAVELASRSITVNCIAPGVIKTDMLDALPAEVLPQLAEETPLRRLGTPEDIAHLAVFLASDKSSFITGQVITADGGFIV